MDRTEKVEVEDGTLKVEVDRAENPGTSKSGKSKILYSTKGFLRLPDGSRININWIEPKE